MGTRAETYRADWRSFSILLAVVGSVIAGSADIVRAEDGVPPCLECIEVRMEHPVVVRGPSPHEPDAPVSVIKLPDGTFRGFTAGGTTLAVDGPTPIAALEAKGQPVLEPGPPGSGSDCGRWITSVMRGLGTLYGLVHNETHCDNPQGSYKTMSIAQSGNGGLNWNVQGQIISSDEGNVGQGEGDCTAIDGHDGYWYAYCLRRRDGKNVVARAPIENPAPGKWIKWSGGRRWDAPGLGGTAAALDGYVGQSEAYWTEGDVVLLLAPNASLRLSISEDKVHFGTVPEPVVLYDEDNWNRPTPSELYAYPSMAAEQGFNDIASRFILTYTYVPPNEDFSHRYLIAQEGWIRAAPIPQFPQMRTALARWIADDGMTWTTTGPAISSRHYAYSADLGYLMTAAPQQSAGIKLDECFSDLTGSGFLAAAGHCADNGSERRRPAGYVFGDEQPGTVALFDCASTAGMHFVSKRRDCDDKGRARLLGFALQ
jgi:hypothetical protein